MTEMQVKLGALTRGHRNRIREILDATAVFRDDEVAVALELFDETFAAGPARAPYDPGDGVANYEFVGSFSREGQLIGYVCYGATPVSDRDASGVSERRRGLDVARRSRASSPPA